MIDLKNIENIFFIGAGGIGMSALARYFLAGGFNIGGYDRTPTELTSRLEEEGCILQFTEDASLVPDNFRDPADTIIIYTPAVKPQNLLFSYFKGRGFRIYKRSELLGMITAETTAIAIAGTHGKTSITALTAHLLKQSVLDCSAFLGGISRNYDSNLIIGTGNISVVEADEYDRSFHMLEPYLALISSLDADHLDIYGSHDNMVEAYNIFVSKIKEGGTLLVSNRVREKINVRQGLPVYTYGLDSKSDFRIEEYRVEDEAYYFNVISPRGDIDNLISTLPGKLNLENTLAAIALAQLMGVGEDEIRKALIHYKGVKRRLDIRYRQGGIIYIDDYAHHPGELDYLIDSLREFYGKRHLTVIFQPHLYSRTRDHAEAFAQSLDRADQVILLPVYPAREEPIKGVSSKIIADRMKKESILSDKQDLLKHLENIEEGILVTAGAGDIDTMVGPIEALLKGGEG